MSLETLMEDLADKGVSIFVEDDQLRIRAAKGSMTEELKARLKEHKQGIISLLSDNDTSEKMTAFDLITADTSLAYEEFALTDIQQAYWIGRQNNIELGGVSTYAYIEIENSSFDQTQLANAWNKLIRRHDMLRSIVTLEGKQKILPEVADYKIKCVDISSYTEQQQNKHLDNFRHDMSHQLLPADQWPLFDIKLTKIGADRYRLHIGLDLLIADFWSMFCLLDEWFENYSNVLQDKEPFSISFRDYVIAENKLHNSTQYTKSKQYWFDRIESLPEGPKLPLAKNPADIDKVQFRRRSASINQQTWQQIKQKARKFNFTTSGVLASAFTEVLAAWSSVKDFSLNLTLFNRLPLHEQVNNLFGDFTSTILLQVNKDLDLSFLSRTQALQQQLWSDLEHRYTSGVQFIRELAHLNGKPAHTIAPIVFTSTLGLVSDNNIDPLLSKQASSNQELSAPNSQSELSNFGVWHKFDQFGQVVYGISQTPQVWLDHQVAEKNGCLIFNWDSVDELFPEGLLDDMFAAYCELLESLAKDDSMWETKQVIAPPKEQTQRKQAINMPAVNNDSDSAATSKQLLQQLFAEQCAVQGNAIALVQGEHQLSYQELFLVSNRIGHFLRSEGAQSNELIAVVMDKHWQQVAGVLGVLNSG
ncbi:Polyketide synthase modules and related proteins, partial [hydrothermal vent metagenome]